METNEYKRVSFSGAYEMGDSLYVSDSLFNGMLKLNKETGRATYENRFAEESILRQGLHGKVFRYGDELVFTPDMAAGIHIYYMVRDEIKYYPVNSGNGNRSRCIDAFLAGDKLWLFYAYAEQPVIIFDLKNHTQEAFYGVQDILPEEIKKRQKPAFWSGLERMEGKIYAGIWESPYIVQVDMDSYEVKIYALEDKESKITGVAFDGEYFWITEADCAFVKKWNPKCKGEMILAPEWLAEAKGLVYCNIVCHEGKVVLIPNSGDDILCVNEESRSLRLFCKLPKEIARFNDVRKNWRRFFFYDIIDGKVLRMYPVNVDMMVDINLHTAEVKGYTFLLEETWDEDKYKQDIVYTYMQEETAKKYLPETKEIDLDVYLDYVLDTNSTGVEQKELRIGEEIWKYVKQSEG